MYKRQVLSEIQGEWETAVGRWMRLNAPLKRDIDGEMAPDVADELMLYQTLVAAWPLDLSPDDRAGLAAFRDRVAAWQEKAVREAKRHSEWAAPNACLLYTSSGPSRACAVSASTIRTPSRCRSGNG